MDIDAEIAGFGFFDDEPNEAEGQLEVSDKEINEPEQVEKNEVVDEGFGFFEPENLPVAPPIKSEEAKTPSQPIVKPVKPKPKAAAKEAASIRVDTTKIDRKSVV